MSIAKLFSTTAEASAAASKLEHFGFPARTIHVVDGSRGAVSVPALTAMGIATSHAKNYAEAIGNGASLVLVETPLGTAAYATEILGGDAASEDVDYQGIEKSEPAPLSKALNLPILAGGAAPLSSFFGLPVLSTEQKAKATLSHDAAPLSSKLGLPTLVKKGRLMDVTLSKNPAPLSSMLGMPVLSGEQKGKASLSHEAAPLSKALGLPVLLKE
jgi:hypothetical protein